MFDVAVLRSDEASVELLIWYGIIIVVYRASQHL